MWSINYFINYSISIICFLYMTNFANCRGIQDPASESEISETEEIQSNPNWRTAAFRDFEKNLPSCKDCTNLMSFIRFSMSLDEARRKQLDQVIEESNDFVCWKHGNGVAEKDGIKRFQNQTPFCQETPDKFLLHQHPIDCSKYTVSNCRSESSSTVSCECESGEVFNNKDKSCRLSLEIESSDCSKIVHTSIDTSNKCSSTHIEEIIEPRQNPVDCTKYFVCVQLANGQSLVLEYQCPTGQMFNHLQGICNENINCDSTKTSKTIISRRENLQSKYSFDYEYDSDGYHRLPINPSSNDYTKSDSKITDEHSSILNGQKSTTYQKTNLETDRAPIQEVYGHNSLTSTFTPTCLTQVPTKNHDCAYPGFFLIPNDCTNYMICIAGPDNTHLAYHAKCPNGKTFSRLFRRCVTRDLHDCGIENQKEQERIMGDKSDKKISEDSKNWSNEQEYNSYSKNEWEGSTKTDKTNEYEKSDKETSKISTTHLAELLRELRQLTFLMNQQYKDRWMHFYHQQHDKKVYDIGLPANSIFYIGHDSQYKNPYFNNANGANRNDGSHKTSQNDSTEIQEISPSSELPLAMDTGISKHNFPYENEKSDLTKMGVSSLLFGVPSNKTLLNKVPLKTPDSINDTLRALATDRLSNIDQSKVQDSPSTLAGILKQHDNYEISEQSSSEIIMIATTDRINVSVPLHGIPVETVPLDGVPLQRVPLDRVPLKIPLDGVQLNTDGIQDNLGVLPPDNLLNIEHSPVQDSSFPVSSATAILEQHNNYETGKPMPIEMPKVVTIERIKDGFPIHTVPSDVGRLGTVPLDGVPLLSVPFDDVPLDGVPLKTKLDGVQMNVDDTYPVTGIQDKLGVLPIDSLTNIGQSPVQDYPLTSATGILKEHDNYETVEPSSTDITREVTEYTSKDGFPVHSVPLDGTPLQTLPLDGIPLQGDPLDGVPLDTPLDRVPLNVDDAYPVTGVQDKLGVLPIDSLTNIGQSPVQDSPLTSATGILKEHDNYEIVEPSSTDITEEVTEYTSKDSVPIHSVPLDGTPLQTLPLDRIPLQVDPLDGVPLDTPLDRVPLNVDDAYPVTGVQDKLGVLPIDSLTSIGQSPVQDSPLTSATGILKEHDNYEIVEPSSTDITEEVTEYTSKDGVPIHSVPLDGIPLQTLPLDRIPLQVDPLDGVPLDTPLDRVPLNVDEAYPVTGVQDKLGVLPIDSLTSIGQSPVQDSPLTSATGILKEHDNYEIVEPSSTDITEEVTEYTSKDGVPIHSVPLDATPLQTLPLDGIPLQDDALDGVPLDTPLHRVPLNVDDEYPVTGVQDKLGVLPIDSLTSIGQSPVQDSPLTSATGILKEHDNYETVEPSSTDITEEVTEYTSKDGVPIHSVPLDGIPLQTLPLDRIPLQVDPLDGVPLDTPLDRVPLNVDDAYPVTGVQDKLGVLPIDSLTSIGQSPVQDSPLTSATGILKEHDNYEIVEPSSTDITEEVTEYTSKDGVPIHSVPLDGTPLQTLPLDGIPLQVDPLDGVPLDTPLDRVPLNVDDSYPVTGIQDKLGVLPIDSLTNIGQSPVQDYPLTSATGILKEHDNYEIVEPSSTDITEEVTEYTSKDGFPIHSIPLDGTPLQTLPLDGIPLQVDPLDGVPLDTPLDRVPLNVDDSYPVTGIQDKLGVLPIDSLTNIGQSPVQDSPLTSATGILKEHDNYETVEPSSTDITEEVTEYTSKDGVPIHSVPLDGIPLQTLPLDRIPLQVDPLDGVPLDTPLDRVPLNVDEAYPVTGVQDKLGVLPIDSLTSIGQSPVQDSPLTSATGILKEHDNYEIVEPSSTDITEEVTEYTSKDGVPIHSVPLDGTPLQTLPLDGIPLQVDPLDGVPLDTPLDRVPLNVDDAYPVTGVQDKLGVLPIDSLTSIGQSPVQDSPLTSATGILKEHDNYEIVEPSSTDITEEVTEYTSKDGVPIHSVPLDGTPLQTLPLDGIPLQVDPLDGVPLDTPLDRVPLNVDDSYPVTGIQDKLGVLPIDSLTNIGQSPVQDSPLTSATGILKEHDNYEIVEPSSTDITEEVTEYTSKDGVPIHSVPLDGTPLQTLPLDGIPLQVDPLDGVPLDTPLDRVPLNVDEAYPVTGVQDKLGVLPIDSLTIIGQSPVQDSPLTSATGILKEHDNYEIVEPSSTDITEEVTEYTSKDGVPIHSVPLDGTPLQTLPLDGIPLQVDPLDGVPLDTPLDRVPLNVDDAYPVTGVQDKLGVLPIDSLTSIGQSPVQDSPLTSATGILKEHDNYEIVEPSSTDITEEVTEYTSKDGVPIHSVPLDGTPLQTLPLDGIPLQVDPLDGVPLDTPLDRVPLNVDDSYPVTGIQDKLGVLPIDSLTNIGQSPVQDSPLTSATGILKEHDNYEIVEPSSTDITEEVTEYTSKDGVPIHSVPLDGTPLQTLPLDGIPLQVDPLDGVPLDTPLDRVPLNVDEAYPVTGVQDKLGVLPIDSLTSIGQSPVQDSPLTSATGILKEHDNYEIVEPSSTDITEEVTEYTSKDGVPIHSVPLDGTPLQTLPLDGIPLQVDPLDGVPLDTPLDRVPLNVDDAYPVTGVQDKLGVLPIDSLTSIGQSPVQDSPLTSATGILKEHDNYEIVEPSSTDITEEVTEYTSKDGVPIHSVPLDGTPLQTLPLDGIPLQVDPLDGVPLDTPLDRVPLNVDDSYPVTGIQDKLGVLPIDSLTNIGQSPVQDSPLTSATGILKEHDKYEIVEPSSTDITEEVTEYTSKDSVPIDSVPLDGTPLQTLPLDGIPLQVDPLDGVPLDTPLDRVPLNVDDAYPVTGVQDKLGVLPIDSLTSIGQSPVQDSPLTSATGILKEHDNYEIVEPSSTDITEEVTEYTSKDGVPIHSVPLDGTPLQTLPLDGIPLQVDPLDGVPLDTPLDRVPLNVDDSYPVTGIQDKLGVLPIDSLTNIGQSPVQDYPLTSATGILKEHDNYEIVEPSSTDITEEVTEYTSKDGFPIHSIPLDGTPLQTLPLDGIPLQVDPLDGVPLDTPLDRVPLNVDDSYPVTGIQDKLGVLPIDSLTNIGQSPVQDYPLTSATGILKEHDNYEIVEPSSTDITEEVTEYTSKDGFPIHSIPLDGTPLQTLPLDGIPLQVDPLDGVPLDTPLDRVPLNVDDTNPVTGIQDKLGVLPTDSLSNNGQTPVQDSPLNSAKGILIEQDGASESNLEISKARLGGLNIGHTLHGVSEHKYISDVSEDDVVPSGSKEIRKQESSKLLGLG